MVRCLLLLALLLVPQLAAAAEGWVEVTGIAMQDGPSDADAARRRALADALLQAAYAGGASVQGHTAVSLGRVTSDLAIATATGRILEHRILSQSFDGTAWHVTLRARVGANDDRAACRPRPIRVRGFAPEIRVSTAAPAWAEPLAQDIVARLRDGLSHRRGVTLTGWSDRSRPLPPDAPRRRNYRTLTSAEERLAPNQFGLIAQIALSSQARGLSGRSLALDLDLALVDGQGDRRSVQLQSAVPLPGVSPLGRAAVLAAPGRQRLAADLTDGVEPLLAQLMTAVQCAPVRAALGLAGNALVAPVGRQDGLSRGDIAMTDDRDGTTQLLEIVDLGPDRTTLRPLDPGLRPQTLAGRTIRFIGTGG